MNEEGDWFANTRIYPLVKSSMKPVEESYDGEPTTMRVPSSDTEADEPNDIAPVNEEVMLSTTIHPLPSSLSTVTSSFEVLLHVIQLPSFDIDTWDPASSYLSSPT